MPLQMNFELTKIFKAKLRVCHCEIRFLTLLLMYAYFPPHFLLQFYASLFTAGMGDTALPKRVSNTLIHLGEEAAAVFFFFFFLHEYSESQLSHPSMDIPTPHCGAE